jgi:hypothetical protein
MPNHWHLVLQATASQLSTWMRPKHTVGCWVICRWNLPATGCKWSMPSRLISDN